MPFLPAFSTQLPGTGCCIAEAALDVALPWIYCSYELLIIPLCYCCRALQISMRSFPPISWFYACAFHEVSIGWCNVLVDVAAPALSWVSFEALSQCRGCHLSDASCHVPVVRCSVRCSAAGCLVESTCCPNCVARQRLLGHAGPPQGLQGMFSMLCPKPLRFRCCSCIQSLSHCSLSRSVQAVENSHAAWGLRRLWRNLQQLVQRICEALITLELLKGFSNVLDESASQSDSFRFATFCNVGQRTSICTRSTPEFLLRSLKGYKELSKHKRLSWIHAGALSLSVCHTS